VACDVNNPLLGPNGSARVYGPQKGASPQGVEILERNMQSAYDIIEDKIGRKVRDVPGAGAAGGLGAGFMAFLNARLQSGIELVLDAMRFSEKIKGADLILTGEGRVDHQTVFGKAIAGIANLAKPLDIPVVVIAGSAEEGIEQLFEIGVTSVRSLCNEFISQEEAVTRAPELIADATETELRDFILSS